MTTTVSSFGSSPRMPSMRSRIDSFATKSTFAPQSSRMYCQSRVSWDSYMGTKAAPSP